jgi:hypothetical protein
MGEKEDIVERIRNRLNDAPLPTEYLLDEAADEIERLRADLGTALRLVNHISAERDAAWKIRENSLGQERGREVP